MRARTTPGVRLNVSRGGTSAAIGERGGGVKLGSREVRATVGVPGVGMSWSRKTGWTGAAGLKPADELAQLGMLLDKLGRTFNSPPLKVDKASAGWKKAVGSFEGGRGPSAAKFQTLMKRFETAMTGCRRVDDAIADRRAALSAIVDRLNAMRLGMFGGPLKTTRKDLLALAKQHEAGAQKLTDAVNRFRAEVCNELAAAHNSI